MSHRAQKQGAAESLTQLAAKSSAFSWLLKRGAAYQIDASLPEEKRKERLKNNGNKPQFDLRGELFRMAGTDLTQIDSIDVMTAMTILSGKGYEQMEDGRPFCFLATAMSGQQS
jgi:hypothetical protein